MIPPIPPSWQPVLGGETTKPYFQQLEQFVADEQSKAGVFPPAADIFAALELTPFEKVNVLVLGQDPYPTPGHAHGLAFSVPPGVKAPASLCNIFKELQADLGLPFSKDRGSLVDWARQGVLLLNTCLTVRSGEPLSHRGKGWETFTDAVIHAVNDKPDPVVFVLWGSHAQEKSVLIDTTRHAIVKSAHPSPLSARAGFFGSRPFSQINATLCQFGKAEIDWRIGE